MIEINLLPSAYARPRGRPLPRFMLYIGFLMMFLGVASISASTSA